MSDKLSKVVEKVKALDSMPARVAVAGAVVVGAGLFLCGSRSPKERIISVRPDGDTEPAVTGVLADDDVALDKVPLVADALRKSFMTGRSRSRESRTKELKALLRMIDENDEQMIAALASDLGRPRTEAVLYDIETPRHEVKHLISNLRRLMAPENVGTSPLVFPGNGQVYKDPVGVVLVIGTWNFPLMLTLIPLAGAIAGGNTVCLKPSNVTPATSKLLGELIPKYLSKDVVTVVGHTHKGDRHMIGALLKEKWDHIFFTGNPTVGRVVMRAAAEHLTPCTLELGGKNPVFIAADANIDLAAKRTVWGRMLNAGQQCVAPDYCLIDRSVAPAFFDRCRHYLAQFYEGKAQEPGRVGRIVNDRRMAVMKTILQTHGGELIAGGKFDVAAKYVEPTVLKVPFDSPVMEDETFGPILLCTEVDNMEQAIRHVANRPHPLSLYIFSNSTATQELIIQNTSAGGVTVNGTILHAGHPGLPFGGVGDSGMGAYHGDATFNTFVHRKPVLRKSIWYDFGVLSDPAMLYPPWTDSKLSMLRTFLRWT